MDGLLVLAGAVADGLTRSWIARRHRSTWIPLSILFVMLAIGSLLTGQVRMSEVRPWLAATVGASVAVLFFLATTAVLRVLTRWPRFRKDSEALYLQRDEYPIPVESALGVVVATGEEIFWRGLVLSWLGTSMARGPAGWLALGGYVATAAATASTPFIIGALVGGAVWTVLALWSGGVLAGIVSHALWTVLMIGFPPKATRSG